MTIDLLQAAAAELQVAVGKLTKDLNRVEGLEPLDGALALVALDRARRNVEQIAKKLAAASNGQN